jgi:hypothetical protein
LSNEIFRLNEAAKLKRQLEGRQLTWPKPVQPDSWNIQPVVDRKYVTVTSLPLSGRVLTGASVYARQMFHGGNQFSIAAISHNRGSTAGAQLYVLPFQVNQTTGAITVGTGSVVVSETAANSETSTSMWANAGTHGWYFGYLGRTVVAAWTVANNVVSGIASQVVAERSYVGAPLAFGSQNSNEDAAYSRVGSTSYFAPGSRPYNSSAALLAAYDWVYSYNGSTLTNTRSNPLVAGGGNNGSQWHFTIPYIPQWSAAYDAGTASATKGFRQYNLETGATRFQTLGSTMEPVVTFNGNTLMGSANILYPNITALELSNGKAFLQTNHGQIFIHNADGTMQDITNSARIKPVLPGVRSRIGWATPVAQDTWWIGNVVTPVEMLKIYVNPNTYDITYLDGFNFTAPWKSSNRGQSAYTQGGLRITGDKKQFMVMGSQFEYQQCTNYQIKVFRHEGQES